MNAFHVLAVATLTATLIGCAAPPDRGYRSEPRTLPPPQDWQTPEPEPRRAQSPIGQVAGRSASGDAATFLTSGDRTLLQDTTQRALEKGSDGRPTQWVNPSSGNRGAIVPQPSFVMNGRLCREYQQTIIAGGSTSTGYGTACRDGGGTWRTAANG